MNNLFILLALLIIMAIAYRLGLSKSRKITASLYPQNMHSRPTYYGVLLCLWCAIPAILIFLVGSSLETHILKTLISSHLHDVDKAVSDGQLTILMEQIKTIASGGTLVSGIAVDHGLVQHYLYFKTIIKASILVLILVVSVICIYAGFKRIDPKLRARNTVEKWVKVLLFACSVIAILTTLGIVLSMLGESLHFFKFVSPFDFFFGTTWNPQFMTVGSGTGGEYGLLPLLWGTIMISVIAMIVAVPIGLMTAIYMSEYAGNSWLRSVAKPAIEVLAGIPTIVYGFFALVTVGPVLHEFGEFIGLNIRATSALTAGLVMGIMIIPFISSLSDDIIMQVPKLMREGSLGLGATRSETIRKVVLPAALPGIVGAFLLAASRAIGETMIVVLAAGNMPILQGNPFNAVSTITVTIVNQLTGDIDFSSPQSLVAFALGLTLFVLTLILNVVALYIVRKYREQYE